MRRGVTVSFLEPGSRLPDDLFRGEEHVVGVEPVVIDVDVGLDAGLLQSTDIFDRLGIKRFDVADEGIAGRKAGIVRLPGG